MNSGRCPRKSARPALSAKSPCTFLTAASLPPGENCAGLIAFNLKATRGFGYDPVFWVPAYEAMVAELDLATKNRISHRGQALRKLKEILAARREEFFATPVP